MAGTVTELWRYPVKSMAGERLPAATLTRRGIPGDRGWAVFDETRAGITGAKRLPPLRHCRARYLGEPVAGDPSPAAEITLPDGSTVRSDDARAAARLSAALGRAVRLESLGRAEVEVPRVTSEGESEGALRALLGLLPAEPLPDLSAFTPDRMGLLRHGHFFDALPLHVLTRTTLATLGRLAPESVWDVRRFRPNVLLAVDEGSGYPEQGWLGRRLRIGEAIVEIVTGCPRCVMVTQPVDELPPDPRLMRTLVRETRHTAGVYATVSVEGDVREGDDVEIVA